MRKKTTPPPKWTFCHDGKDIPYPEALKFHFKNKAWREQIYILSPIRNINDDYIFLFPEGVDIVKDDENSTMHFHKNYIFFNGRWYTPEDCFENTVCVDAAMKYREGFANHWQWLGGASYRLPFPYFDLTTEELADFRKQAIQPVRDLLKKYDFLKPDKRGESDDDREMKEEQLKFVDGILKKNTKRPSVAKMQERWVEHLCLRYPNDRKKNDKYCGSEQTIRRRMKELEDYQKKSFFIKKESL
ncbi:MAG: hypothetical protein WC530_08410 [Candidatus Omnitrophota bacterium]|jgi:hypothetical protein